mgnify:CR=1 FL=1
MFPQPAAPASNRARDRAVRPARSGLVGAPPERPARSCGDGPRFPAGAVGDEEVRALRGPPLRQAGLDDDRTRGIELALPARCRCASRRTTTTAPVRGRATAAAPPSCRRIVSAPRSSLQPVVHSPAGIVGSGRSSTTIGCRRATGRPRRVQQHGARPRPRPRGRGPASATDAQAAVSGNTLRRPRSTRSSGRRPSRAPPRRSPPGRPGPARGVSSAPRQSASAPAASARTRALFEPDRPAEWRAISSASVSTRPSKPSSERKQADHLRRSALRARRRARRTRVRRHHCAHARLDCRA